MPIFFKYYKQIKQKDPDELLMRFNQLCEMGRLITTEKEMIRRALRTEKQRKKRTTVLELDIRRECERLDKMRNADGKIVVKFN